MAYRRLKSLLANIMLGEKATFAVLVLVFYWNNPVAMAKPVSSSRVQCRQPVARLLNDGDWRFRSGNLLCDGDRLTPIDGKKLVVLCFQSRRLLTAGNGLVGDLCNKPVTNGQPCGDRYRCLRVRGGEQKPRFVRPLGNVLMERRPDLSWEPVVGATRYSVRVTGKGVRWQKSVTSESLVYPSGQPSLQYWQRL